MPPKHSITLSVVESGPIVNRTVDLHDDLGRSRAKIDDVSKHASLSGEAVSQRMGQVRMSEGLP